MILKLNERIGEEMVDKVVAFYNEFESRGLEKAIIYLHCQGGSLDDMELILDLIERNKEDTILCGYGMLQSFGFEMFFKAKCEKVLLGDVVGMFHLSSIEIDTNEKNQPVYAIGKTQLKFLKDCMKPRTEIFCKILGMTKKECDGIWKGNDVFFMPDRMKKFLEASKVFY